MDPEDLLIRQQGDELHCSLGLVVWVHIPWAIPQIGKFASKAFDFLRPVLSNCFFFRQSNSPDHRIRKHDSWNIFEVSLGFWYVMEQPEN